MHGLTAPHCKHVSDEQIDHALYESLLHYGQGSVHVENMSNAASQAIRHEVAQESAETHCCC